MKFHKFQDKYIDCLYENELIRIVELHIQCTVHILHTCTHVTKQYNLDKKEQVVPIVTCL